MININKLKYGGGYLITENGDLDRGVYNSVIEDLKKSEYNKNYLRELAEMSFAVSRGLKISKTSFSPRALRNNMRNPSTKQEDLVEFNVLRGHGGIVDHPYYFRDENGIAKAIVVHLYNVPKNIEEIAENHGLSVEFLNIGSWWNPDCTTPIMYTKKELLDFDFKETLYSHLHAAPGTLGTLYIRLNSMGDKGRRVLKCLLMSSNDIFDAMIKDFKEHATLIRSGWVAPELTDDIKIIMEKKFSIVFD